MTLNQFSELKLVISDIDNTLIHPFSAEQDTKDLLSGKLLEVDRGSYIDRGVMQSLKKLMGYHVPLVLATSRRITTYRNVSKYIEPLFAIVEDGCVILSKEGEIDKSWAMQLEDFVGPLVEMTEGKHIRGILWQFKAHLAKRKIDEIKIVDDGFMASFKLELPIDLENISADDIKIFLNNHGVEIPEHLKISINTKYDSISVIPRIAGKAQATDYLLKKLGMNIKNVVVLGDDYNDEELLAHAGYPITLMSAQEKIRKLVIDRGGIVVSEGRHKGTKAMINILLQNIEANSKMNHQENLSH